MISDELIAMLSLDCFASYVLLELSESDRRSVIESAKLAVSKKILSFHSRNSIKSSDLFSKGTSMEFMSSIQKNCIYAEFVTRRLLCYTKAAEFESVTRKDVILKGQVHLLRENILDVLVDYVGVANRLILPFDEDFLEVLMQIPTSPWDPSVAMYVKATDLFDNVSHHSDSTNKTSWDSMIEDTLDEYVCPSFLFYRIFQSNAKLSFLENWRLSIGEAGYSKLIKSVIEEVKARASSMDQALPLDSELSFALSPYCP